MRPYLLLLFLSVFIGNAQGQNGPTALREPVTRGSFPHSVQSEISAILLRARSGNDVVYWPALTRMARRMEHIGRQFVNGRARSVQAELLLTSNAGDGSCRVKIDNTPPGEYQLRILNSKEEVVYLEVVNLKDGSFQKTLPLSYLPKGVYPVVLLNKQGGVAKRKQLVVAR